MVRTDHEKYYQDYYHYNHIQMFQLDLAIKERNSKDNHANSSVPQRFKLATDVLHLETET